jgi:signal transduction histidine kinase/integral membrane sensor domain MASE1/CheY-like chemotaxis protein
MGRPDQPARLIAIGAAVAISYVVTAKIGFQFAYVAEQVTTVWAPSGIGLAALVLWGPWLWPALWVGAFVANVGTNVPLWAAAAVATGNTAEAVAGAWALRRFARLDPRLGRIRDVLALILLGAAGATTLSATIGVVSLCAAGAQPWQQFLTLWWDWWIGDAVGVLIVAPTIMTAARELKWSRREWVEAALVVASAMIATHVVFGEVLGPTGAHHPLEYVIFPFVIAAAARAGQPLTSLVILSTSAVTIWHTVRAAGPFANPQVPIHDSLLLLQAFMGVLAGTGLLLAAAIAERGTGERRRAAAYAVGEVLAGAPDLTTAAPAILRAICENLEWQIGALWLVEADDSRLRCLAVWSADDVRSPAFADATRQMVFKSGVGLPGRVLATGKAEWIENVIVDPNFPRAAVAAAAGLHGAFGFPILLDQKTFGIIECFNRTIVPPDPDLLRTMSAAGYQVGQFIARKRDLAARTAAEREREQLLVREATARREAEAANRAKDEFLATLSHELRTPLNAIVGWSRMLTEGAMDQGSVTRALQVIDRNAQLLSQLVADILDVSRIITGGLRLDRRPVDLAAVIGAAFDAVRPAAEAKRVQLRSTLQTSATVTLGDPQRLQQIVWNLLSNAVKFTESGGTVSVQLLDIGARGIQIRVEDDGAGIDPIFLPHVFERFRQADGSVSRQHGGLGLGLAIVRHLVELHGGTVSADSPGRGKGSTFVVELPRAPGESGGPPETTRESALDSQVPSLTGCRLLVVDDEPDALDLIKAILTDAGAEVRTASSVSEALTKLNGERPHVLLADIGLPGTDGYSLIREVRRRDAESNRHLPAAAITAYAGDEDCKRVLAAGFDRHLPKPISRAALIAAVASLSKEWPS